jgi:hypothetical protein
MSVRRKAHQKQILNKTPWWWLCPSLVQIGSVVSEKKIFEKVYRRTTTEVRRTPSDGNSIFKLFLINMRVPETRHALNKLDNNDFIVTYIVFSWTGQKAMWAIAITWRSTYLRRRPSVNFFKNLLLWNHWTNLNQTWTQSSSGCLV